MHRYLVTHDNSIVPTLSTIGSDSIRGLVYILQAGSYWSKGAQIGAMGLRPPWPSHFNNQLERRR